MVLNAAARLVVGRGSTSRQFFATFCSFSLWLCPSHRPSLLQSRCPRSGWYLRPFWSPCSCVRWSVRSTNQNNQAWPTELFYRCCSSRLELTSTTSPLSVHKSPTVSSWAQDTSSRKPTLIISKNYCWRVIWTEPNWTFIGSASCPSSQTSEKTFGDCSSTIFIGPVLFLSYSHTSINIKALTATIKQWTERQYKYTTTRVLENHQKLIWIKSKSLLKKVI